MSTKANQILLYAKGWFQKGDVMSDLQILVADYLGVRQNAMNPMKVVNTLTQLVYLYHPLIDPEVLARIAMQIVAGQLGEPRRASTLSVVEKLLGLLGAVATDHSLGKPDPRLLPINKSE